MFRFHFWGPGSKLSFWHVEHKFSVVIYENIQKVARILELKREICAGVNDLGLINKKVIITTVRVY